MNASEWEAKDSDNDSVYAYAIETGVGVQLYDTNDDLVGEVFLTHDQALRLSQWLQTVVGKETPCSPRG